MSVAFGCAVQARSRAGLDSRGAAGGGDRHGGDGRGTAQRLVPRERGFPLGPRAVAREGDGSVGSARGGSSDAAGDAPGSATNQGVGEGPQAQGEGAGGDHGAPCAVKKTCCDRPTGRGRMISLEDRQSIARSRFPQCSQSLIDLPPINVWTAPPDTYILSKMDLRRSRRR